MARIQLLRCLKEVTGVSSRFQTQPFLVGLWRTQLLQSTSVSPNLNCLKEVTGRHIRANGLSPLRSVHTCATVLQHGRNRAYRFDDFITPENFDKGVSFEELGVKSTLIHALKLDGISVPTLIQYESLPITFARDKHCIIHSETGTGKTLTFLLPALQDANVGLTTLIVVPTRELAIQMQYQAVKLAGLRKNSKRILAMYSGVDDDEIMSVYRENKPNILIGTAKKMLQLLETNLKDFEHLRRVVLDEADKTLLVPQKRTTEKKKQIRELHPRPGRILIEKLLGMKSRRHRPQLICTSATISRNLQMELSELGWGVEPEVISTSDVSRLSLPKTIDHCFIQCSSLEEQVKGYSPVDHPSQHSGVRSGVKNLQEPPPAPSNHTDNEVDSDGELELDNRKKFQADPGDVINDQEDLVAETVAAPQGDKLEMLVEHFKKSGEKSALVFIHRGAPIDRFVYSVRRHNISTTPLYKKTTSSYEYSEFLQDFKSGQIQLAVATEETVRGLDFSWLKTVYLMEVPRDACEYLHLCGRVGRVGREGRAVVLLDDPQEMKRLSQHYRKVCVEGREIKL